MQNYFHSLSITIDIINVFINASLQSLPKKSNYNKMHNVLGKIREHRSLNLYKNRAVVFTNRRGMQNISSAFTKRCQGREIHFAQKCHVANKIILRYNIATEKSSLSVPAPCAVPFAVFCVHHLSQLSDTLPQLIEDN